MKNLFKLLISIMLFLNISVNAFAADNTINNLYKDENKLNNDVENTIINKKGIVPEDVLIKYKANISTIKNKLINDKSDFHYGSLYKVYIVKFERDTGDKLDNLSDLLNNSDSYWEFPIYLKNVQNPVSTARVDYIDDDWKISMVNTYIPLKYADLCSNNNKIETFLNNKDITNIQEIKHFVIAPLYADFLYIVTNNNEYIIPLMNLENQNLNGLRDNTVYTKDTFVKDIKPYFDPNNLIIGTTGIPQIKKRAKNNSYIYTAVFSVIAISVSFILIKKFIK